MVPCGDLVAMLVHAKSPIGAWRCRAAFDIDAVPTRSFERVGRALLEHHGKVADRLELWLSDGIVSAAHREKTNEQKAD